jgi:hypothetical protein
MMCREAYERWMLTTIVCTENIPKAALIVTATKRRGG